MSKDTIISVEPCERVYREAGLLTGNGRQDAPDLLYVCDFDNTIATVDVGNAILQRFAGAEWWDWADRYRRGEIGSHECLTRQYASFDANWDEYTDYVCSLELDPDFRRFVVLALAAGRPVFVVSDGVGNYIELLFAKYDIPDLPIYTNLGIWSGGRLTELTFPHFQPACDVGCANCKFRHVRLSPAGTKVYVGDGVSDQYAAQAAHRVYAKDALQRFLAERGVTHVAYRGFADIIAAEGLEDACE